MRRKRGLEARSRASGSPGTPAGQPVPPPAAQPAPRPADRPADERGPAWAQVATARPAPVIPGGQVLGGTVRRLGAWVIDLVVLYVLFLPVLFLFEQSLGPIATWREDPVLSLLYTESSALARVRVLDRPCGPVGGARWACASWASASSMRATAAQCGWAARSGAGCCSRG